MDNLTSALRTLIKNIWYKVYGWPVIMLGIDSDGNPQPFGVSAPSGGGGGGIPITPGSVTPNFSVVTTTFPIPVGAINASIFPNTGTYTLNGVQQPNTSWNEPNRLASAVTIVVTGGSVNLYYGT